MAQTDQEGILRHGRSYVYKVLIALAGLTAAIWFVYRLSDIFTPLFAALALCRMEGCGRHNLGSAPGVRGSGKTSAQAFCSRCGARLRGSPNAGDLRSNPGRDVAQQ